MPNNKENALDKLIDVFSYPVSDVLKILLQDKTTKKNIIWATDAYSSHGSMFSEKSEIMPESFTCADPVELKPRILKSLDAQHERTRQKGEVFI